MAPIIPSQAKVLSREARAGTEGKTFFPEIEGEDDALRQWLGDENDGLVQQILDDPDYIVEMRPGRGRRVVAVVENPDGHILEVAVQLAPAPGGSEFIEKVTSVFPISGDGVKLLDDTGKITTIGLQEEAKIRDEHRYPRPPGGQ